MRQIADPVKESVPGALPFGMLDQVKDVVIHDDIMGSDHCPVTLELNG